MMTFTRLLVVSLLALAAGARDATPPAARAVPFVPEDAWGPVAGGVRAAAWVPQQTFPEARAVVVTALRNVSDKEITADYWSYQPIVTMTGEDGKIPFTRLGKRVRGLDQRSSRRGSVQVTRLRPGELAWQLRVVSLDWDLSVPGEYVYELSFAHKDDPPGQVTVVKAPPVTFGTGGFGLRGVPGRTPGSRRMNASWGSEVWGRR